MKNSKKLISLMLLIAFAVTGISIPLMAESENDYILYEEFTGGAADSKWTLNKAVAKDDVLVLAEGVNVANNSIAATATYPVNETSEKNLAFDISFDVKPGKNLTTITQVGGFKGNLMPVTFDKSGEICINSYGIGEEKSRTYKTYVPDNWYHVQVIIDQTQVTCLQQVLNCNMKYRRLRYTVTL